MRVTRGVMVATGDHWRQFDYLLENAVFAVMVGQALHVKHLPGRGITGRIELVIDPPRDFPRPDHPDPRYGAITADVSVDRCRHDPIPHRRAPRVQAGTRPVSTESAGLVKSTRTRSPISKESAVPGRWHVRGTRLHPERAKARTLHQLEAMGYQVTVYRAVWHPKPPPRKKSSR